MKEVLKTLAAAIFMLWLLISMVVVYFLYDRFSNPGWKSMSNTDLILYGEVSIVVLIIFIGTRFIKDK